MFIFVNRNKIYVIFFIHSLTIYFEFTDPTVRENSAEALGTAWKVVSEKNIVPFLTTVDAIKLAKVSKTVKIFYNYF